MLHDVFGNHVHMDESDHVGESSFACDETIDVHQFDNILREADGELYPGSRKKKLDFLVKLYQSKLLYGMSDAAFGSVLAIIRKHFPMCETLPPNLYYTKKIIRALGLDYQNIDACRNNCMLFWKEHVNDIVCAKCGASRYKQRKANSGTIECTKHSEIRTDDGVLRHPADSLAWKHLDNTYPDFARECRNVRLGLASDGFNPFGMHGKPHSTWPVLVVVYNLPPWMCMKQPYIMMSLLIPGKKSPGDAIDVFLQPFIDDLRHLWTTGLQTYDTHRQETFIIRAALLWTINDFPAYAMLSGWSTSGEKVCPTCGDDTNSLRLKHGKKFAFMGHRRWLPMSHRYRRHKKTFNGSQEFRNPPKPRTAIDCLLEVTGLTFRFGKGAKASGRKRGWNDDGHVVGQWTKKTIFFDLPYWKDLLLRHNLDVMHIERNVAENVIGTLLEIEGKNKDGIRVRVDLVELGIRHDLHPRADGGRTKLPATEYNMKPEEKRMLCQVLESIRVPDNYSSNISNYVNIQEKKFIGLKSHDYHMLLQVFLSIAIRKMLPKSVVIVLLELSRFFRHLCSKTGTEELFNGLSKSIALTLCHLEKLFPPSFFTVMVHLIIHLADEATVAGPVPYRWMYPIERYLHLLKSYVRNKSQPEGCIAVADGRNYDVQQCDTRQGLPLFSSQGKPASAIDTVLLERPRFEMAHRRHMSHVISTRGRRTTIYDAERKALDSFPQWCRDNVHIIGANDEGVIKDDICALAVGPMQWVNRYTAYIMNGNRFKVASADRHAQTQNSGVFLASEVSSFATTVDRNPRYGDVDYYGVVTDIIGLDYHNGWKVILFDCDWFEVKSKRFRTKKDEFGFTLVNCEHHLPSDDSFILGSQATQVFYVQDPIDTEWFVATKTKPRDVYNMLDTDVEDPNTAQDIENTLGDDDIVQTRLDVAEIVIAERLSDL
ncbi:uncharacterized protein LOC125470830 [Pyrus x bretschneideri]|uniref:uncharacterized protein LOC125470830 n=1 Tax=Pyrus x bretschneideri TaxID=225117 RepID=UPI00202E4A53|nr:uncharacterized protein LOC125470830 [Pyrus x bretschneideri]